MEGQVVTNWKVEGLGGRMKALGVRHRPVLHSCRAGLGGCRLGHGPLSAAHPGHGSRSALGNPALTVLRSRTLPRPGRKPARPLYPCPTHSGSRLHGFSVRSSVGHRARLRTGAPQGHPQDDAAAVSSRCSAFHSSEGASPADERPRGAPPARPAGALSGVRVLVVEDDPDARELVTAILEDAGAVVEAADSAANGFAALRAFRPQLLLSDISMPDEDGYSLIRRVRALDVNEGGSVPSIALTAYTRVEDRAKALRAGFDLHMGKPVRPVDLVAAVRTLATSTSN